MMHGGAITALEANNHAVADAELIARAHDLLAEIDRLRAQRDALLRACEAAWTDYGRRGDISATSLEKMEAAIASARERQ